MYIYICMRAPRTEKRKNRVTSKRNPLHFLCVIVTDLLQYCCPLRLLFLNHIASDY